VNTSFINTTTDDMDQSAAGPASRQSRGKARHRLRVLVAEDSPANQLIVERMLHSRGHEVSIAENGVDAVEAAAREPFDVVLMDIQMPQMDGIEATRRIRKSRRAAGIPIVGFSAYTGPVDRANCFAVGMNAFLAKPADFQMLVSTLERITDAA
jgi:two-component system sensor histidine kinase/response regulator